MKYRVLSSDDKCNCSFWEAGTSYLHNKIKDKNILKCDKILKNLSLSILNVKKMFFGPPRRKQNTEMVSFDEMMVTIITKTFSIGTSKRYKTTSAFVWVLGSSFGLHHLLLWPHFFVDDRKPIY